MGSIPQASTAEGCPPVPPAKPSAPVTVATSLCSAPSHTRTQRPQGFPLHLVPPLVGDMKHKSRRGDRGYLNPAALSSALCPNSSRVSTSQQLSFRAPFSHTVPFPARRTPREATRWLCSVGISRTTRCRLNPARSLPQAQRRAGVTQPPPPEEPNLGPEPSCKALPSGVGPAPLPHAYPPAMAVRGCIGRARSWALRAVVGLGPGRVPKDSHKPGTSP